jgi:hypothetical protein
MREEAAWELMEFIFSNERVTINLSIKLLSMINNVVSCATCGFKCNDQDEFMFVIACKNQKEILYLA